MKETHRALLFFRAVDVTQFTNTLHHNNGAGLLRDGLAPQKKHL